MGATLSLSPRIFLPMGELHFFHVFPTFDAGGLEVRAVQLMEAMGRGVRHSVVSLDGRTGALTKVSPSVRLELVQGPRARHPLGMAMSMADALRAARPDLVLTYNWGAIESIIGARLARVDHIVHHEDGFGPEESAALLTRRVYLRRCLLPAVRAVVVPSKRLERMALEVWRQPAERVYYLANGVDVAHFHGAAHGPREGADVVIGHVGRFRPEKNQQGLIRAFAQSELLRTRARLLFVGDGPELAAAQALAAALGVADRVRFAGVHRDPAPLYREMDVFALSSTTEQMPLSVLEAMATGLPVVSTRVGDVADMISEPNRALVVPLGSDEALGHALGELVRDPEQRRTIGAANRAHVEHTFPLDQSLRKRIDLYMACARMPARGAQPPAVLSPPA